MVNPRNCYQNYNVAINCSDRPIWTHLGLLKPTMANLTYCSAGQLSPLLNDPLYEIVGIGTSVWLAGSHGHVHAEGTQHGPSCERGPNDVPTEGALGLTAVVRRAKEEGLTVVLHNLTPSESRVIVTLDDALQMMREIGYDGAVTA